MFYVSMMVCSQITMRFNMLKLVCIYHQTKNNRKLFWVTN